MGFDFAFLLEVMPTIAAGGIVTVAATFGGYLTALILGLGLCLATLSRRALLSRSTQTFLLLIRNTPLLIQLYIWFYVLPDFGVMLSAPVAGTIALGLHYSTYIAEVYRGGIEAVPKGQWEAARVLGFTPVHTWRRIILPQAIRMIIPTLANYLIAMYKSTPYLATITVHEMLERAMELGALKFRYIEPLLLVGLIFLFVSLASAMVSRRVEAFAAERR